MAAFASLLVLLASSSLAVAAPARGVIKSVDCAQHIPKSLQASGVTASSLPKTFTCNEIVAPLDYSKPDGPTLTIGFTMNKAPSMGAKQVLFFNPGGPGVEVAADGWLVALGTPQRYMPDLSPFHEDFDIVTMDPRGMFTSSNINCDMQTFIGLNSSYPRTQEDYESRKQTSLAHAASCVKDNEWGITGNGLYDFFGADSVAKDMDLIRSALHFPKMSFLGISYGTFLGQQLFKQFPDTLDRVVLDGVYASGMTRDFTYRSSIIATNRALDGIDAICQADAACPLKSMGKGGVQKAFMSVVAKAENGDYLSQGVTADRIRILLSFAAGNPQRYQIPGVLGLALQGNVSIFTAMAPNPLMLGAIPQSIGVFCHDLGPEMTFEDFNSTRTAALDADKYNVVDTIASVYFTVCAGWPGNRAEMGVIETQHPYMIVVSDGDSNTPREWATSLWQHSPNAVLVTRHGEGHPTYTWQDLPENPARQAIIDYIKSGSLPAAKDEKYLTVYAADADRHSADVIPEISTFPVQLIPPSSPTNGTETDAPATSDKPDSGSALAPATLLGLFFASLTVFAL